MRCKEGAHGRGEVSVLFVVKSQVTIAVRERHVAGRGKEIDKRGCEFLNSTLTEEWPCVWGGNLAVLMDATHANTRCRLIWPSLA